MLCPADALRAERAFLSALAQAGAVGAPDPFDETRVIVQAPRKGVSVRVASATLAQIEDFVARGLCVWTMEAGRARLRLADDLAPPRPDPFTARTPKLELRQVGDGVPRLANAAESPLAWLARRGRSDSQADLFPPHRLEAGERLRRDMETARMLPRVTVDWAFGGSGGAGAGPGAAQDAALAARQRASAALDAVGGDLAGLLVDICGFLKGLETVEFERGWPRRSAKLALALALERLAGHYGLHGEARGQSRAPMRGWRAALEPSGAHM